MEDLSKHFKRMEDEMLKLAEECVSNKTEIINLKKRLNESDRKIEVLEKTKATIADQDMLKCTDVTKDKASSVVKRLESAEEEIVTLKKRLNESNQKIEFLEKAMAKTEGKDVMKRLEVVERECQDVTQKCQTFSKLQHLLNNLVLKSQNNSSVQIQINKLHNKIDSLTSYVAGDIKKAFEENMQKVKDHRIFLNREEYVLLGALESLCDLSDKPACQSCKSWYESSCIKKAKELISKFVTHLHAMEEYNRICADNSSLFEGSYFYRCTEVIADRGYTLAISAKNLLMLDDYTKKLELTYKKDKIKKYYNNSNDDFIYLYFQNDKFVILDTFLHAEDIQVKFRTVMGI